jgi:hypothetical protein
MTQHHRQVLLLFILVVGLVASFPHVHAYKHVETIGLSNGRTITVYFDDNFPDAQLARHAEFMRTYIPQIAELYYMPDHDFEITYTVEPSPNGCGGASGSGGYHSICLQTTIAEEEHAEATLVHEAVHVFQAEFALTYSYYLHEAEANAVSMILTRKEPYWSIDNTLIAAENGLGLYGKAKTQSSYVLTIGIEKLYAYHPTIFRERESQTPAALQYRDPYITLLGGSNTIIDSRPIARWMYDQGIGTVGPTEYRTIETGIYAETYTELAGGGFNALIHVWQWTNAAPEPVAIIPQQVSCRAYTLTGEYLADAQNVIIDSHYSFCGGDVPGVTDLDAVSVDVQIQAGGTIITRRLLAFRYFNYDVTPLQGTNYVALVDNNGMPLPIDGTATITGSITTQVPVTGGIVKFPVTGNYGIVNIDVNTPSLQYHYANMPILPQPRGVVVNPQTPYLGIYTEKWHATSSETIPLIVTSYPAASGAVTIQYTRLNEDAWQTLVEGALVNGRYEYIWEPTGDTAPAQYLLKATLQNTRSNTLYIEREPGPQPPPPPPTSSFAENTKLRTPDGRVWIMQAGQKHWIATEDLLNRCYGGWASVQEITQECADSIPTGADASDCQPSPQPPQPPPPERRCVIATAAYGSEMAPEVAYMRYVRDNMIGSTQTGRTLVNAFNVFYYSWSPRIAQAIAQSSTLQALFRILLAPLVLIIHVTAWTYITVGNGAFASVIAFAVAAALSTFAYVILPVLAVIKIRRLCGD